MTCRFDCDCKDMIVIYDDRGPQGASESFYRQPDTDYKVGEIAYLEKESLLYCLECITAGTTSSEDLLEFPPNKTVNDTFEDGTVTWVIRKIVTNDFTGDLNVSGKTTTKDLEVTNNAVVDKNLNVKEQIITKNMIVKESLKFPSTDGTGGYTTLSPKDIQKLYDSQIAPAQMIHVSVNGNDETGIGTGAKPFATIKKAVTAIKANVPKVTIILADVNNGEDTYYLEEPISNTKNNTNLIIKSSNWNAYSMRGIRPNLLIKYNHTLSYSENGVDYWLYGNIIATEFEKIQIEGIDVSIDSNNYKEPVSPYVDTTDEFMRAIFKCQNLSIAYSKIELKSNSLWYPNAALNNSLTIHDSTISGTGKIPIVNIALRRVTNDPTASTAGGFFSIAFAHITAITISGNTTIESAIKNNLLGRNTYCAYKNF